MATKTQREFKKQMKELEKDGKLPQNYYAKRRIKYTGGGVSVVLVLLVLWYTGIFRMIFGLIFGLIFGVSSLGLNNTEPPNTYNGELSPQAAAISEYYDRASNSDEFIYNVYLDIYKRFYDNKPVADETFAGYKENIQAEYENIASEQDFLQDLSDNYKEDLDVTNDMLDFAIEHNKTLTDQDKRFLDTLSKKSQVLSGKREELWRELWDKYDPW